jgi:hypothetical protein
MLECNRHPVFLQGGVGYLRKFLKNIFGALQEVPDLPAISVRPYRTDTTPRQFQNSVNRFSPPTNPPLSEVRNVPAPSWIASAQPRSGIVYHLRLSPVSLSEPGLLF